MLHPPRVVARNIHEVSGPSRRDSFASPRLCLQMQPPTSRSRFAYSGTLRVHNPTQEYVRVNTIRFVTTFRTSPTPRGPVSTGGPDNAYSFGSPLSKLSQHRSRGAHLPASVCFHTFPATMPRRTPSRHHRCTPRASTALLGQHVRETLSHLQCNPLTHGVLTSSRTAPGADHFSTAIFIYTYNYACSGTLTNREHPLRNF